ncbi:hypothetical protein V6D52_06225 [Idiomarina loihiensis]|uniref:hypothetical protein n=1 Tax=Idiomarina loihiensis TaxID=135577 RepID=UPI0039BE272B
MRNVGKHLGAHASSLGLAHDEFDSFARSAFNRHYYAIFLSVRSFAKTYYPEERVKHNNLPDKLRGKILKDLKKALKQAEELGVINSSDAKSKRSILTHSLSELANIVSETYRVRCIADYDPEVLVQLSGNSIILDRFRLAEFEYQLDECNKHTSIVFKISKELSLL